MIGFFAGWVGGEIVPDPTEIVEAGWFRRDALPPIPPVDLDLSVGRLDRPVAGSWR